MCPESHTNQLMWLAALRPMIGGDDAAAEARGGTLALALALTLFLALALTLTLTLSLTPTPTRRGAAYTSVVRA